MRVHESGGWGGRPVRSPGRSVAFAAQQGGRPFVLQRRVVAAGAPHCAAKRSGAPMSPAPVSPPSFHRLLQFLYCSSCDICIPLLSGVSAVPQCMSEAGSDGALLRRPGCDHGFMEHEGASAMAARCHDSSRLHCGTQRLQDPSAAHKKYACCRRRIFCA